MMSEIVKKQLLKKGILNLAHKQGFLFGKFKEPDKFRASKTHKSVRKVSKTRSCNKFINSFSNPEIC